MAASREVRLVADLGNSRLKWGLCGPDGEIVAVAALPIDDPDAWDRQWRAWVEAERSTSWAVSSVNPPIAESLNRFLMSQKETHVTWFRSAADVPLKHTLDHSERAGADRAFAAAEAGRCRPQGACGQVVSCGTAVTVEWIDADGVWKGGAITAGMGLMARSLNLGTAQLPAVGLDLDGPPSAIGNSTLPALRAGVFWGVVGAVRELIERQSIGQDRPWRVWTGGDAGPISHLIDGPQARVVPDLVLRGIARLGHRDKE